MPSDYWIDHLETFNALAMLGAEICKTGVWLTFGITPTSPATRYGYIEADAGSTGLCDVRSFTEKPDLATAETYLVSGKHFWNSGIFTVQAGAYLESFHRHQPNSAKLQPPAGQPARNAPMRIFLPSQNLKRSRQYRWIMPSWRSRKGSRCLTVAGAMSEAGHGGGETPEAQTTKALVVATLVRRYRSHGQDNDNDNDNLAIYPLATASSSVHPRSCR